MFDDDASVANSSPAPVTDMSCSSDEDHTSSGDSATDAPPMPPVAPSSPRVPVKPIGEPRRLWHRLPPHRIPDRFGYQRNPAYWFTLNLAYNHLHEIHLFADAVAQCKHMTHATSPVADTRPTDTSPSHDMAASTSECPAETTDATGVRKRIGDRCRWAQDNADIGAFLHAVRIELLVELVMRHIVSEEHADIFQHWLRFEFGVSGNPHVHGLNYVHGNPSFELVVESDDQRDALIKAKYPGATSSVSYTHLTLPTIYSV